eukprot:CAMPEP_0201516888 /NCGR_PEP_ID=MMETSP0161_2-20130828/8114_1 /ASSEMBLY_ACC=CAM_ASM_000251 /TAXON_ID=180227 /ORGANISM="Neoparamoeba aestuarina, Strain SoJaBio B1-5/56/2" /LENGTH=121 /DNA_ID=CAMNT_0047914193 /DNA_START=133 /DNA_END=498 /DNA_ORIENTATION=+
MSAEKQEVAHVKPATRGDTIRLYTKAAHIGYKRGMRTHYPNTSLLQLEGVRDKAAARYYLGKRVAYIYRARSEKGAAKRVMWGKITRTHGNSGVVRANFRHNLPPKSLGATLRVMMYPSKI